MIKIYRWQESIGSIFELPPSFEIWQDNQIWLITINDMIESSCIIEVSRIDTNRFKSEALKDRSDVKESNWLEILITLGLSRDEVEKLMTQVNAISKVALVSKNTKTVTIYDLAN